ncbi:uncharacterized protein LOC114536417 [Dendronephthya gigantea]|uniref:uncharacterized protein LOC114536417 n=1 Tax=Dendronephthya gigantea TaxID=151771 RepID=UPI00106AEF10|nr:uncharacterized protein LOC114536417 [Dendronephthya gigantea]
MVVISVNVCFWCRQTDQRMPNVVGVDSVGLALRITMYSDTIGMVCPPASKLVSEIQCCNDIRDRRSNSVFVLCTSTIAPYFAFYLQRLYASAIEIIVLLYFYINLYI